VVRSGYKVYLLIKILNKDRCDCLVALNSSIYLLTIFSRMAWGTGFSSNSGQICGTIRQTEKHPIFCRSRVLLKILTSELNLISKHEYNKY
jgi:hypothetical protein